MLRVHYVKPNDAVVSVEALTTKILHSIMDDENPEDLDIYVAKQAIAAIMEVELSDTLDGLLLIDPKAISILTALVYTGIKLKNAEHQNSLSLKEANGE